MGKREKKIVGRKIKTQRLFLWGKKVRKATNFYRMKQRCFPLEMVDPVPMLKQLFSCFNQFGCLKFLE